MSELDLLGRSTRAPPVRSSSAPSLSDQQNFVPLRPSKVEKGYKTLQINNKEFPVQQPIRLVSQVACSPCQGEGRGFESRRPLQRKVGPSYRIRRWERDAMLVHRC